MHPSSSSSSSSFSFTRFYFYSFFFVFSSTDTSGRVCSVGDETKNGKFKKTAAVETWSQRGGPDEWPIQNRNDFEKERERQYRTDIRKKLKKKLANDDGWTGFTEFYLVFFFKNKIG